MLTCVTDLAYGDTGKGKIIDAIADQYDVVVRFNGGPNAGHTVVIGEEKHVLHHLPSGIFSDRNKFIVLSGGMVIDPVSLANEIKTFRKYLNNLLLSERIHCIMPWHINEDIALSKKALGTTSTGIGPCYADKMYRTRAVRLGNLLEYLKSPENFTKEMIDRHRPGSIINLQESVSSSYINDEYNKYLEAAQYLSQFIENDSDFLRTSVNVGLDILFESANGIHLDIDHGGYPFVTSSGCGPAFIPQSCGLPNVHIDSIIGITKSYTTRVGSGELATELTDAMGDSIRRIGNEFGSTTGRPRRIGWLDLDVVLKGLDNTGTTDLAITHMDTLILACKENNRSTFEVKLDGKMIEFPIWEKISDKECKNFLNFISEELECKISYLGTGRERRDLIRL